VRSVSLSRYSGYMAGLHMAFCSELLKCDMLDMLDSIWADFGHLISSVLES
jgi:hypothetical protein